MELNYQELIEKEIQEMSRGHEAIKLGVNVQIDTYEHGKLIKSEKGHNLVVLDGLNLLRDMMAGNKDDAPSHIAVGDDNTTVIAGDSALGNQVYINTITKRIQSSAAIKFQLFISESQANGNTLREAGLISQNPTDGNRLFARYTFSDINKTASISVTISWQITLSAV